MATAALPAWALETGACAAALALPHAVYALVWTRPTAFARASGAARHGPVAIAKQFATLAVGMKVIQLLFYLRWYLITIEGDESGDVGRLLVSTFSRAGAARLAAAAVLLCSGGSLNHAVYTTLGAVGVYYGNRFGAVIPWVEGYPFNVFPHPQYLGSILCVARRCRAAPRPLPHPHARTRLRAPVRACARARAFACALRLQRCQRRQRW